MYYQNYHQFSAVQTALRLVPMFFSGIICNVFFALMAARVPLVWLVGQYIDTLYNISNPHMKIQALQRCQQARQFFCSISVNRQCHIGPSNSRLYGSLSWASTWYSQLGHYSLQRLLCPTSKVWQEPCLTRWSKYVFFFFLLTFESNSKYW